MKRFKSYINEEDLKDFEEDLVGKDSPNRPGPANPNPNLKDKNKEEKNENV
jgi:hypothetical protein